MLLAKAGKYSPTWWQSACKSARSTSASKSKPQARTLSSLAKQRHTKPFAKPFCRTVMTTAEEDFSAPGPNKDLRKHGKTVEFLMGVPETQSSRKVLIYQPTPRTTQSGTKHTQVYMKFDRTNNRKNESLMGWTATEDPTGILRLTFPDSDAAIAFAQRNGLDFELVVHEGQEKSSEPRDYAVNFKYKPRNTLADDFDL